MYSAGSAAYALTEILYRGHTHFTMVILGGICAVVIHLQNKLLPHLPFYLKMIIAGASITLLELLTGIIVNVVFSLDVWDYSDRALNLLGQICPLYSFFWIIISIPALLLSNAVIAFDRQINNGDIYDKKTQENI